MCALVRKTTLVERRGDVPQFEKSLEVFRARPRTFLAKSAQLLHETSKKVYLGAVGTTYTEIGADKLDCSKMAQMDHQ